MQKELWRRSAGLCALVDLKRFRFTFLQAFTASINPCFPFVSYSIVMAVQTSAVAVPAKSHAGVSFRVVRDAPDFAASGCVEVARRNRVVPHCTSFVLFLQF